VTEPAYTTATRIAYDIVANDYAELLHDELAAKPFDRAMLDTFAELVHGARIADVGCGPGRVTAYLDALGCDAFGVDLSPEMIAVARRSYPQLHFEVGTMTALACDDDCVGGVVAWYSIIHTPPALLPAAFIEFARVLRSGGHLLLAFQVGDECVELRHAYGHDIALDAYRLSPDDIATTLATFGFDVVASLVRAPYGLEKTPQAFLIATAV
jgi:SAM-dependent methyltransferase